MENAIHPNRPQGAETLARLISGLLNPISTSTLVFWAFVSRSPAPAGPRTVWLLLAFVFSTAIPLAYLCVLRRRGDVPALFIPDRRQRIRPLLVGIGSYLLGVVALSLAGAPGLLVALMGCYAASTAAAALVNLRWKISLHAVGAWGTLVALCHALGYRGLYLSPLAFGVIWARFRLGAHTPAQLAAGSSLGMCITFILLKLWT
jgi:membrane-associated phospholipid phosphatase